jgi:hypothetical protein
MHGQINLNVFIAVVVIAFGLGGAVGMFIMAMFAVRNYHRGYKDCQRDEQLKKIQAGDILEETSHAG